ncbi:hypothetical protein D5086_029140 [Populus alba]|uniref:Uncharacterized protein n=1 Tax=Populus alba TaxID=43335 RepID=A0ACC4AST1_POPAL
MWMTDKRYLALTSRAVAVRLDLISKVHGIEQVENYFNNIPTKLKGLESYGALLNCYAYVKSVEKAEAVMQRMRELGFARKPLVFTVMLNLYYKTGNTEKLDPLMREMEENGISLDKFAYCIRLSSYAAASDIEGMEKTLKRIESDPNVVLDWATYATVANGYSKVGLLDKALEMLKRCERLITGERRSTPYDYLMTQYATTGTKEDVLRHLKDSGDMDNAEGFINLLREKDIISLDIQDKLLDYIKDRDSRLDALSALKGSSLHGIRPDQAEKGSSDSVSG